MSRVVYSEILSTADQQALRVAHSVRLVLPEEEGTGVNALPEGVYGFTYSPSLPNAPLFADRRYRSYEIHKVAGGEVFIVGFTTTETVRMLSSAVSDVTVSLIPEPDGDAATLVMIPYSRIRQNRQHATPNQHGALLVVSPGV